MDEMHNVNKHTVANRWDNEQVSKMWTFGQCILGNDLSSDRDESKNIQLHSALKTIH